MYEEVLAFTAFGLDQFKERAERDGAALAILATHRISRFGGGALARMSEMAAERGIPVIDQGDYIHRQGAELRDANWMHDAHWNPRANVGAVLGANGLAIRYPDGREENAGEPLHRRDTPRGVRREDRTVPVAWDRVQAAIRSGARRPARGVRRGME